MNKFYLFVVLALVISSCGKGRVTVSNLVIPEDKVCGFGEEVSGANCIPLEVFSSTVYGINFNELGSPVFDGNGEIERKLIMKFSKPTGNESDSISIDWGDGNIERVEMFKEGQVIQEVEHLYTDDSLDYMYNIRISGKFRIHNNIDIGRTYINNQLEAGEFIPMLILNIGNYGESTGLSFFYSVSALETIDLTGRDFSLVGTMEGMFLKNTLVKNIILNGVTVQDDINVDWMFFDCSGLETLDLRGVSSNFIKAILKIDNQLVDNVGGVDVYDDIERSRLDPSVTVYCDQTADEDPIFARCSLP